MRSFWASKRNSQTLLLLPTTGCLSQRGGVWRCEENPPLPCPYRDVKQLPGNYKKEELLGKRGVNGKLGLQEAVERTTPWMRVLPEEVIGGSETHAVFGRGECGNVDPPAAESVTNC